MADQQTAQSIECPKCGHNFSATQAFEEHIALEAQKLAATTASKLEKQYEQKLKEVRLADAKELDEKAAKRLKS